MAHANAARNLLGSPAEQELLPVARNEHEGAVRSAPGTARAGKEGISASSPRRLQRYCTSLAWGGGCFRTGSLRQGPGPRIGGREGKAMAGHPDVARIKDACAAFAKGYFAVLGGIFAQDVCGTTTAGAIS
jgi:hypothetical protein